MTIQSAAAGEVPAGRIALIAAICGGVIGLLTLIWWPIAALIFAGMLEGSLQHALPTVWGRRWRAIVSALVIAFFGAVWGPWAAGIAATVAVAIALMLPLAE